MSSPFRQAVATLDLILVCPKCKNDDRRLIEVDDPTQRAYCAVCSHTGYVTEFILEAHGV